ncbi:hypothetical protein E1091_01320 [Micromonospora fluostatini]|uniref:Uncharacterized protein n=1 Tax=Micromonospora fluostatini TaxID=1629071 RepID=A0ABY2DMI2_9ACTN|nr:hypothetical protein E1091_01320 [Micromonospora fluostatini]
MSTDIDAKSAALFRVDTANHFMAIKLDQGLYRHLRFRGPRNEIAGFEVVTWPGALAVRGDIDGGYIFTGNNDMLDFFRRSGGDEYGLNLDYWATRLRGGRSSVWGYDESGLRERLQEALATYRESYPALLAAHETRQTTEDSASEDGPTRPEVAEAIVDDAETEGALLTPGSARRLLIELEQEGVLDNARRWELEGWTWSYRRACHAIRYAVDQYDAAKALATPAVPA